MKKTKQEGVRMKKVKLGNKMRGFLSTLGDYGIGLIITHLIILTTVLLYDVSGLAEGFTQVHTGNLFEVIPKEQRVSFKAVIGDIYQDKGRIVLYSLVALVYTLFFFNFKDIDKEENTTPYYKN